MKNSRTERGPWCPLLTRPGAWPTGALLLALLGMACHDSSSGGGTRLSVVSGRVLDDRGEAVPGALIEVASDPLQATTDSAGRFLLEVPLGFHELRVEKNGLTLCEACFTLEGSSPYDLGDLYPGRESGCGGPRFCAGDLDCDGIPDTVELAGWDVLVALGDGTTVMRTCSSDPGQVDTDRDGLTDLQELAARTDPERRDTDGDALPDFSEIFAYKSNPCMVDSDGDSRGPEAAELSDPNLWDGFELALLGTSPILADTDGDGLSDWEEVHSGGINPLVADLPRMNLDLHGDPTIVLNVSDSVTHSRSEVLSTLEKESEDYKRTDTESTKMSIENTVKIHQELEAGTGKWPPSYSAKITADTEFKHGYATESLSSWTETSVREAQENYETKTSEIQNISYDDGMLWTGIKIVNDSDLSFKVRDLRLVAYRMKPNGSFSVIGNMRLGRLGQDGDGSRVWLPFEGDAGEFVLGPSAEYTDLVGADRLPAQVMRALVSNPTAVLFEIGSYSLYKLDDFGNPTTSFATLGETVVQRTGLIVIDYGDGQVERYMVATNVHRYPDGSGRGLRLGEALAEVIGLRHETTLETGVDSPRRVLTRIRTVEAFQDEQEPAIRGLWIVGGTSPVFEEPLTTDFDDIVLKSGERISLTFVKDSDGDGLFDREEYLLDTLPGEVDTDVDGVSDYAESKVGWMVQVQARDAYRVHPDPRFPDVDGDFLVDASELVLGTDPYLGDTDGDGLSDAFDAAPLASPCLSGQPLNLSAWWDGTAAGLMARDTWTQDSVLSDGTLSRAEIATEIVLDERLEPVFSLNSTVGVVDSIDVPTLGVSPMHEYSVSMWLYWEGMAVNESWGTLLSKGPRTGATYALSISGSGKLRTSIYRHVRDKCVFWGCDGCCADGYYNELTELESATGTIPLHTWTHVTATFSGEYMRLYVDGEKVAERHLYRHYTSGLNDHYVETMNLIQNPSALRIGADPNPASPESPFRGFMDEVQYFHRGLNAEEARQLYLLGVCAD